MGSGGRATDAKETGRECGKGQDAGGTVVLISEILSLLEHYYQVLETRCSLALSSRDLCVILARIQIVGLRETFARCAVTQPLLAKTFSAATHIVQRPLPKNKTQLRLLTPASPLILP